MLNFIYLIVSFFQGIFATLDSIAIPYGNGYDGSVSLLGILSGCLIIGIAVTVFWKGAQG